MRARGGVKPTQSLKWREFRLGDLFDIRSNPQLNKDSFNFNENGRYAYFTRTVLNNGILGYVDYLNETHKIKGGCLAIGMLGMQFFYMENDFYAGQFTKRAIPKNFKLNLKTALFFTVLLNKFQNTFCNVLVRDFKELFLSCKVRLLCDTNNKPDFEFMTHFISAIQKLVIKDIVLWNESKKI